MIVIHKNDVVQCPQCKTNAFKINRDLKKGDVVGEDCLDYCPGITPYKKFEPMLCRECSAALFDFQKGVPYKAVK